MADIKIEDLAAQLGALQERQSAVEQENADLKSKLAELAGKALKEEPAKALEVPKGSFSHKVKGGKEKEFTWATAGYLKAGEIISAAEIMADPKLIDEILAIGGQGILKEKL